MVPSTTRRSVLRSLAAGATALLAGCQAPSGGRNGLPSTSTGSPPATPQPDDPTVIEHVDIGDRAGGINPYSVEVWNDVSRKRTVAVRVVDLSAGKTPYETSLAHPPNGSLEVSLRAPHDYRVQVDVPTDDLHRTVQVTERQFDTCNDYRTQVVLLADAVEVRTLRTDLLCRTATAA